MSVAVALMFLPGLVIGITVHECAHAWSASLLGDDYPRRLGRVSLNPLRHMSPLGTLALLVLPFGWGRPVLVNLHNFRHPRRDFLLSSLAGPAANVVVVALVVLLMQVTRHTYLFGGDVAALMQLAHLMLMGIALINAILAAFNLIPIPPLDGSKIWPLLIPGLKPAYGGKASVWMVVLLVFLLTTHALDPVLHNTVSWAKRVMPTSDSRLFDNAYERGATEYAAGEYDEAERHFGEALEYWPGSPEGRCYRAMARGWNGDWSGALDDMNRAIEVEPAQPAYFEFRARILDHFGRTTDAEFDRVYSRTARELMGSAPPSALPRGEPVPPWALRAEDIPTPPGPDSREGSAAPRV